MGFIYENILRWIKKEVAQVSYDPRERLAWLRLVQEAVEEVLGELEAIGPNSVLVDNA